MDNPTFERRKLLESDMEKLGSEIAERRRSPGVPPMPEQELLRESIKSIKHEEEGMLPDYAESAPEAEKDKIEVLLNIAFSEGVGKANALAEKADAYVMDAFHDALTGELYPILKDKGIL